MYESPTPDEIVEQTVVIGTGGIAEHGGNSLCRRRRNNAQVGEIFKLLQIEKHFELSPTQILQMRGAAGGFS